MADRKDSVHEALSELLTPGGGLWKAPSELNAYFDDLSIVRSAHAYMARQKDVISGGLAIVVSAGPPGSGKSQALGSLELTGYRLIDPDEAKDLLLRDAEKHGLLRYRHDYLLPDEKVVGVRELATHIHAHSTRVTDLVRKLALAAGENVIIDGTLSWRPLTDRYLSEFSDAGYEGLDVVDVEAPVDLAIERARTRWWRARQADKQMGGRFVPDDVIRACFGAGDESMCAENALILAEGAGEELGHGRLRRFDLDRATGKLKPSIEKSFG